MKTWLILLSMIFVGCSTSTIAQHITNWNHRNAADEDQVRKAASQLSIGMPQKEAIRLLATNGLHATSGERYEDWWSANYCFTNGSCSLKLVFRQKPGPTGLVMQASADYSKTYTAESTNWLAARTNGILYFTVESTNRFVAMTNGVLHVALFQNVQVARTNAP